MELFSIKIRCTFQLVSTPFPTGAQGRALRVGGEKIILALCAPVFFPAEP